MSVASVGFGGGGGAPQEKILCDDELVVLRCGSKKFEIPVGTLRKFPGSKFDQMFPVDTPTKIPPEKEFCFDRNPELMSVVLDMLRSEKLVIPAGVSEAAVQQELAFWKLDDLEPGDGLEEDDTESDSPQKLYGVPSNVRVQVGATTSDQRLDTRYSMRADEMFGRAIALTRQEDTFVKVDVLLGGQGSLSWGCFGLQVSDIQHGLALLRELLSMEHNNVSYMYYLAYGELRLGRTAEASYWVERVLRIDPANLAAASLRTLINDRRKQNSITGLVVLGGVAALSLGVWVLFGRGRGAE